MTHIDTDTLLATEACILAENDTHAAVMIRIPKNWVYRNVAFLAALVDLAILRPPKPAAMHDQWRRS